MKITNMHGGRPADPFLLKYSLLDRFPLHNQAWPNVSSFWYGFSQVQVPYFEQALAGEPVDTPPYHWSDRRDISCGAFPPSEEPDFGFTGHETLVERELNIKNALPEGYPGRRTIEMILADQGAASSVAAGEDEPGSSTQG